MPPSTIISADRHERVRQFLKDLWDYRELFYTFLERDVKVRYKQTALGVIWVILQPLFMMGAFSIIFGKIARMPSDGLPYTLFYLAALLPWTTFAAGVTGCAQSMEANAGLISKIYFPRLVVPGASVCRTFVDYAIAWVLLNIVAITMGYWHWQIIAFTPLLIVMQALTALGIGLVLAALNAQYRDVQQAIGFIIQAMMLATPVIYPISKIPLSIQPYLFLNPMVAVVTSYRDILKGAALNYQLLALSLFMAVCYLAGGVWFFRKREGKLADIL